MHRGSLVQEVAQPPSLMNAISLLKLGHRIRVAATPTGQLEAISNYAVDTFFWHLTMFKFYLQPLLQHTGRLLLERTSGSSTLCTSAPANGPFPFTLARYPAFSFLVLLLRLIVASAIDYLLDS